MSNAARAPPRACALTAPRPRSQSLRPLRLACTAYARGMDLFLAGAERLWARALSFSPRWTRSARRRAAQTRPIGRLSKPSSIGCANRSRCACWASVGRIIAFLSSVNDETVGTVDALVDSLYPIITEERAAKRLNELPLPSPRHAACAR